MTDEPFLEIRRVAEKVLSALKTVPKERRGNMGAVNWGDLRVVEVAYVEPDHGENYFLVRIEEAANDCGLAGPIIQALTEAGFPNVEIICEW